MFSITKVPVRTDNLLIVTVAGKVLTINGEHFDFTAMPLQSELPIGSVSSENVLSAVRRDDVGVIHLDILCPYTTTTKSTDRVTESYVSGPVINGGL